VKHQATFRTKPGGYSAAVKVTPITDGYEFLPQETHSLRKLLIPHKPGCSAWGYGGLVNYSGIRALLLGQWGTSSMRVLLKVKDRRNKANREGRVGSHFGSATVPI